MLTVYEKERILNTLRHWYSSHKNSMAHYQSIGNEKASDYHKSQMQTLVWMANVINKLETLPDFNLEKESKEL